MEAKFIFLSLYILTMLFIGVFSAIKIRKPDDFYLAGKKNSTLYITGSLLATIIGSTAILGTINLSYTHGWASAWLMLCASIGCFALLPLSKYVRRFGKYTLPQMLNDFYGESAQKFCSIIIPIAWLGVIAAQVIGSAMIISGYIGLTYENAVVLTGIIFITYTIIGGQISVIKTDFVQSIMIFIGLIIFAIFLFNHTNINLVKSVPQSFPFNKNFSHWDLTVLLITYSSTFCVGPDIYSRLFCARNEKVAFKSVLLTAVVLVFFAFLISYIGVSLAHQFPHLHSEKTISLITAIDAYLPAWISGLVVAALLSAVLSSAATTLLTSSTILSEPLLNNKNNSKEFSIKKTRIVILLMGITSIIIALKVTSIISSLLIGLTIFSGAFIIPVAAGLFGYRISSKVGITAMLFGGGIALSGKLIALFYDAYIGNMLIISAFLVNALILFVPSIFQKKQLHRKT